MHNILERVWDFILEHGLLTGKEKNILVGLSGGADSVCLLFMLKTFKDEGKLGNTQIIAAHLNHGIRGDEAVRDEDFVKGFCKRMSVKLFSKTLDIPGLAKESGEGEEETGRKLRYGFFREVLESEGGGIIATAHHKNDLAETVLLNISRGTGLTGLAGIRARQGDVVRPLICLTRREIEGFNENYGLEYVTDSTNQQDIYTRNYLRNRVIPLIEANVNPGFTEHIYRLSDIALRADEYLEEQAEALSGKCLIKEESITVPAKEISCERKIIREYLLRLCFRKIKGSSKDLSADRVNETDRLLMDAAEGKRTGKIIELGSSVYVMSDRNEICFSLKDPAADNSAGLTANKEHKGGNDTDGSLKSSLYIPLFIENTRERLEAGEEISCFSENIEVRLKLTEKFVKNKDTDCTKFFDYDTISSTACLRYAGDNDYIAVSISGIRHSLKKELKDRKIPAPERRNIMVLAQGNECLWAVGVRRSMSLPVHDGGMALKVTVKIISL